MIGLWVKLLSALAASILISTVVALAVLNDHARRLQCESDGQIIKSGIGYMGREWACVRAAKV